MADQLEGRRSSLLPWPRMGREIEFGATRFAVPAFSLCGGLGAAHTATYHDLGAQISETPVNRIFHRFFVAGLRDVDRVRPHWPSTPAF